jgi:hypothetical protein
MPRGHARAACPADVNAPVDEPELRTRVRDVPALAGLAWIRQGLRAFGRQPAGFMGLFGMFLLAVIASSLPLALLMALAESLHVGTGFVQLFGVILLPLLSLGFMLGTEAVTNDLRVRPHLLFAALGRSSRARRSILALGLAYVALLGLATIAGNSFDGGEALGWIYARLMVQQAPVPTMPPPLSNAGGAVLALKALVIALGSIPLWHAPALVHWGRQGARQAMFGSVVALWHTRAAFAVFLLAWLALAAMGSLAINLLAIVLDGSALAAFLSVIISWAFSAAFYATLWFGFVDTFEITRTNPERAPRRDADPAPR